MVVVYLLGSILNQTRGASKLLRNVSQIHPLFPPNNFYYNCDSTGHFKNRKLDHQEKSRQRCKNSVMCVWLYTYVAVTGRKRTTLSGVIRLVECFIEITPDLLCPFMNDWTTYFRATASDSL